MLTDRRHALAAARTVLILLGLAAPCLPAATPGFDDPQFARAAVVVTLFDRLEAECAQQRRHDAEERARLDAWQARHGIAAVRRRVAELAADTGTRAAHQTLLRTVEAQLGGFPTDRCAAVLALVKVPDAQLAATMPALLARLDGPRGDSANAPAAEGSGDSASALDALAGTIDSFGFDSALTMGVGGFLTTRIFPVVLFSDGRALLDVEALAQPAALAAHQRANPADWTRWRRAGGELQLERRGREGVAWKRLPLQTTYPRLPDGFRLDGRFRSLRGAGNLAVGGTDSVVAYQEYTFARDGTVLRGGGAGASAGAGETSVASASRVPAKRGRYRIEGLLLSIDWDDGSRERRLIVADPQDPKTALWLDGTGYVRR